MGKEFRASLAITDTGLANAVRKYLPVEMMEVDVMARIRIHELAKNLAKKIKKF